MPIRKILHVIGQRPEMTGSGIYLQAVVGESQKRGFKTFTVAGVPAVDTSTTATSQTDSAHVVFESGPLDFPVVGMSDVMPYRSSLFKDLRGRRLTAYKAAFTQVLRAAVKRFDPDLIHTNHLFLLSALARERFPDLPIVTTCHGTELRQFTNCPHLRPYVKRHCRQIDRIIALTHHQRQDIHHLYDIPPDRIAVVGGGYDDALFRRAAKAPAGTVQLLYAGKMNRSKGVPWLLRSLARLRRHDWHLHLAGSGQGEEYEHCIALARGLGEKVTVHGYVSQRRLAELMQRAHLQVLPSFFEGLPLVLFEGLACGCRIVTTDLSGFGEILGSAGKDTIHRLPLPPLETIDRPFRKDEARLETALCESLLAMMAAVRRRPDYADPLAEAIAADYTWARVFDRTLAVYQDAVRHPAAREGDGGVLTAIPG